MKIPRLISCDESIEAHGAGRLPKNAPRRMIRNKQYSKKVPSYHVQVDVKFLKLKNKDEKTERYQYTAIDDARVLKLYKSIQSIIRPGILHVYIKPRTPQLIGKVERSHRTDQTEFYQLLTYIDDVDLNVNVEA